MGILAEPLDMIKKLPLEKGFTVCELGDQYITFNERRLASEFYNELGCGRYESIDGNGRGTITADLNKPLPNLKMQFDLVTDFGTGEHIFDQRQVFKSIHLLTVRGGYFVFDRPCQGYKGHCYWLADECVWKDFAAANDYDILRFETKTTSRGELIRGVMQRKSKCKFRVPQQGRYKKLLRPIADKVA